MRKARQKSRTGFYHTVIRGVNKQNIFFENRDRFFFKNLMNRFAKKYGIKYHAYVLMDNHVHFLLEDPHNNISRFMQVLCSVYAKYFNKKYDRIGHLFQDRFASEIINDNEYLIVCCRYILQNPQRAGLCKASEYKWSSYHAFRKKQKMIYTSTVLGCFGSLSALYRYLDENNNNSCLEIELRPSEKRINLIKKIKCILNTNTPIINPELDKEEILGMIRKLRNNNISINNIARITGIGRYLVQLA